MYLGGKISGKTDKRKANLVLKGDEFNGDTLSNAVATFFHIFAIVLLVECGKSCGPRLTERHR